MSEAGSDDDDDVDPFDALMGIDAEEFSTLLDASPPAAGATSSDGAAAEAPLCRGGVPCVQLGSISGEEFREKYLLPRKPVIVQDPSGETMPMHLTPRYLRDTHGSLTVPLDVTGAERTDVSLAEFIQSIIGIDEDDEDERRKEKEEDASPAGTSDCGGGGGSGGGAVMTTKTTVDADAAAAAAGQRATTLPNTAPRQRRRMLREKYLRNLQMVEWFPEEAAGLRLPDIFGPNMLHDADKVPTCPPNWRRWFELFVCHPECRGFPFLHRDTCHVHAASMQISGGVSQSSSAHCLSFVYSDLVYIRSEILLVKERIRFGSRRWLKRPRPG